jgi:branched-chain amino acid transport system substrate-binding protein
MTKIFTKISTIFLLFALFSCTEIKDFSNKMSEKIQEKPAVKRDGRNQFESRNLIIPKEHKEKTKVAIFLPFSGKNRDLSWHLFNAAVLSLFENDSNHEIELVPIDSMETPQETAKAFQTIVDRKIKLVIGPIFSSDIEIIKNSAQKNNITVLSLSNNHALLGNINDSGGIFLGGLMPETQIDKMVAFAMKNNKTNFAIIAPNTQYGMTIVDLLKTTVENRDGNFTASEVYYSNLKGIEKSVERIVNSFTIPSQLAEGGGNKIKKDEVNISKRSYVQVIVIPETGKNLAKIAELIKAANKDERDIQIIGTSEWDNLSTLGDGNLIGSWFCAPIQDNFHSFAKRYNKTYSKTPPRIASISYDLVFAITKLMSQKKTGKLTPQDFVNYENSPKNGFEGVDGLFRFLPNGFVQRNLAILEVKNDHFEMIGSPNSKFLKQ